MSEYISIAEIAQASGITRGTVRRWLRLGRLKGEKEERNGRWVIRREDFRKDVRDRPQTT